VWVPLLAAMPVRQQVESELSKPGWQLVPLLQAWQASAEPQLAAHGGADAAQHLQARQRPLPLSQSLAQAPQMPAETASPFSAESQA